VTIEYAMRKRYNFVKWGLGPESSVAISITRSHTFGLSAAFRDMYDVDQYRFAVPYFDDEKQLIVLRFSNDERDKSRIPIQKRGYIHARPFFRQFQLDVRKIAGRYTPVKRPLRKLGIDESGDGFVIDLKAPTAP
jgi:hypothetical protein